MDAQIKNIIASLKEVISEYMFVGIGMSMVMVFSAL